MEDEALRNRLLSLVPDVATDTALPSAIILNHNAEPCGEVTANDITHFPYEHGQLISDLVHRYCLSHPSLEELLLRDESGPIDGDTPIKAVLKPGSAIVTLRAVHLQRYVSPLATASIEDQSHSIIMTPSPEPQQTESTIETAAQSPQRQDVVCMGSQQVKSSIKLFTLASSLVENLSLGQLNNVATELKKNLQTFVETFEDSPVRSISRTVDRMRTLSRKSLRCTSTIAVMGEMGVGKSTLINAILGDQRLAPTSGSEACTSVATEFLYNTDQRSLCRAEIQFKCREEIKEWIETLLSDITSVKDIPVVERTQEDRKTAKEAQDLLASVCPVGEIKQIVASLTDEDISEAVEALMEGSKFQYLDKTGIVSAADYASFSRQIQRFMNQAGGYWPLIKVVRIYTRSPALATGAVIVDLPGLGDRSRARADLAESYLQRAQHLWIVTHITRAANSESTVDLIDRSLRYQAHMDGTSHSIAIVATGSDRASPDEVRELSGFKHKVSGSLSPLDTECSDLIALRKETKAEISSVSNELQGFAELGAQVGLEVHDTGISATEGRVIMTRKRKREKAMSASDTNDLVDIRPTSPENKNSEAQELETFASRDQILGRIKSLKFQLRELEKLGKIVGKDLRAAEARIFAACIQLRNDWCKERLQKLVREELQDFGGDSEGGARAESCSIYTTSAPAFMEMSAGSVGGRVKNGFVDEEATEIPQLRLRCTKDAEKRSSGSLKDFVHEVFEEFNDISVWATQEDAAETQLSPEQIEKEAHERKRDQQKLHADMRQQVMTALNDLRDRLASELYPEFDAGIDRMEERLPLIVERWERQMGWSTYRAVCRRQGLWENRGKRVPGDINWREEIRLPLIDVVHDEWHAVLVEGTEAIFALLEDEITELLENFDERFAVRNEGIVPLDELAKLRTHVGNHKRAVSRAATDGYRSLTAQQQTINRRFEPMLTDTMQSLWSENAAERGLGTWARMKKRTQAHVERNNPGMFVDIKRTISEKLEAMLDDIEKELLQQLQSIVERVSRAYEAVGINLATDGSAVPAQQLKALRNSALSALSRIEPSVKAAIEADPDIYLRTLEEEDKGEIAKENVVDLEDLVAEAGDKDTDPSLNPFQRNSGEDAASVQSLSDSEGEVDYDALDISDDEASVVSIHDSDGAHGSEDEGKGGHIRLRDSSGQDSTGI